MMNAKEEKAYLEFFRKISRLTLNHDVINDTACVTADKLGEALEAVDPEWWTRAYENR